MKIALIGTPGIPVAYSSFETAVATTQRAAQTTGSGYPTPSLASRT
jgi:hypothetical protein